MSKQSHSSNETDSLQILKDPKRAIVIGRIATVISILMYVSYIAQIIDNLHGHYGNPIQPLVAAINCVFWCYYAMSKSYKDIPVFVANFPGIFFALAACFTSFH